MRIARHSPVPPIPSDGRWGRRPACEKMNSVDQKLARVERLLAEQPARFSRQGTVVATWRVVAGERHGPYYSLRYRDGGRQCSLYLGSSATLAESVRQLLECRQRVRREHLALTHARSVVKASLRQHKRLWRRHLEQAGLSLKGYEIRGWKQFHIDSNRLSVDGSDDQLPSATAARPAVRQGRRAAYAAYLGERWSPAGVTLETWLQSWDTSATGENFTNLRTAAEGAFASDPANVQYGYWRNACRWEAEVARFPTVAPCLQPMPARLPPTTALRA